MLRRIRIWHSYPSRDEAENSVFIVKEGPEKYVIYHRRGRFKGFCFQAETNRSRQARWAAVAIAAGLGCEVSRG